MDTTARQDFQKPTSATLSLAAAQLSSCDEGCDGMTEQTTPRALPFDLTELDAMTLLRLPSMAIAEARRRRLVRTWDLPVGGYAEHLAGVVYHATPLGAASKGHDLVASDQRLIEVKAIAAGMTTSPIRPDELGFDAVVVVRFEPETLAVLWALELPRDRVERNSRPHRYGGRTIRGPRAIPAWEGAVDLTAQFVAAQQRPLPGSPRLLGAIP